MEAETDKKPTIRREKLDELRAFPARAGRASLLVRVVGLFHQESVELLGRLAAAIDRGDPDELREAAHKFKSVAGNVGAEALAALCERLELVGLERRVAGAAGLLARLRDEHRRVTAALVDETPDAPVP